MIPANVELRLLQLAVDDRLTEAADLAVDWAAHDGLGAVDHFIVRLISLLDVLEGVAS